MKRFFLGLFIFIMIVGESAARTVITTYDNPYITTDDVIDVFLEELNKPRWAYGLYDYEVFNTPDKQNNPWSVEIKDCSYGNVSGEEVILNISNGYFTFKTFGGETTESTIAEGVKKATNLNDEKESYDFYKCFENALKEFAVRSYKWEMVYDKASLKSKDTAKLFFINYLWWFFKSESWIEYSGIGYEILKNNSDLSNISYISELNFSNYYPVDFSIFEGQEFTNDIFSQYISMTKYENSLGRNVSSFEFELDELPPEKYSKVLLGLSCMVVYDATTKKKYNYYELILLKKNGQTWQEAIDNIENGDAKEEDYIEITYMETEPYSLLGEDSAIGYYEKETISSFLGEEVCCREVIDLYNKEIEEQEEAEDI